MCSGSYNNNSRTPPSVNILERWMVGWAEPDEVTENGLITLAPVSENKGYLVQTPTTNDYFLLENRDTGTTSGISPSTMQQRAAACWYTMSITPANTPRSGPTIRSTTIRPTNV